MRGHYIQPGSVEIASYRLTAATLAGTTDSNYLPAAQTMALRTRR